MPKPKVLISDALSPAAVQIFKDRGIDVDFQPNLGKDKEKLAEIIGDYDGLAIRSATKATAKILERAKRLKVIGRAGIGVDNVEIPAATAKGIIVMNTPFGNSITTAEHAITLMLALAREIPQADASTQAGKWEKNRFMGVEITAKTLGVIGCGNIGSIVADRALGLRMKVIAFDPFLSLERARDIGVEKVDLDDLLKRADFITLHTPLTEKTKNIIDAAALAKMKKGVRLINCARGGLVDEQALIDALNSGHVAGAADHLQPLGLVDDLRGRFGRRADRKPVVIADDLGELVLVLAEIGLEVDLDAAVFEYLHSGGRERIGNENFGFCHLMFLREIETSS